MTSNNASAATRSAELERIAHYREQAAQYRQWAADETVAEARDGLLDMARQYDRLAGELEAKTGITATRSPTTAEHDMQAKRVSGATDAQTALAIGMNWPTNEKRSLPSAMGCPLLRATAMPETDPAG
jgi:hypothetical protein